jgi:hypothetical protein
MVGWKSLFASEALFSTDSLREPELVPGPWCFKTWSVFKSFDGCPAVVFHPSATYKQSLAPHIASRGTQMRLKSNVLWPTHCVGFFKEVSNLTKLKFPSAESTPKYVLGPFADPRHGSTQEEADSPGRDRVAAPASPTGSGWVFTVSAFDVLCHVARGWEFSSTQHSDPAERGTILKRRCWI